MPEICVCEYRRLYWWLGRRRREANNFKLSVKCWPLPALWWSRDQCVLIICSTLCSLLARSSLLHSVSSPHLSFSFSIFTSFSVSPPSLIAPTSSVLWCSSALSHHYTQTQLFSTIAYCNVSKCSTGKDPFSQRSSWLNKKFFSAFYFVLRLQLEQTIKVPELVMIIPCVYNFMHQ